jgi:hypothetical protein
VTIVQLAGAHGDGLEHSASGAGPCAARIVGTAAGIRAGSDPGSLHAAISAADPASAPRTAGDPGRPGRHREHR